MTSRTSPCADVARSKIPDSLNNFVPRNTQLPKDCLLLDKLMCTAIEDAARSPMPNKNITPSDKLDKVRFLDEDGHLPQTVHTLSTSHSMDSTSKNFSSCEQVLSSPIINDTVVINQDCPRSVTSVQEHQTFRYYPENVIRKDNGILLVKPHKDYFCNSDKWKYCCLGFFTKDVRMDFDLIKDGLIKNYRSAGLLNVFSHHLGFYVLEFDSAIAVSRAVDCSPLYVNGHKLHVHRWWERYQTTYPLTNEKVWIELSNVPFSYWSIEGLCLITSAIGKPISFHKETLLNAIHKTPSDKALICVDILVGSARPGVIMTTLPGHSDKYIAMVNVAYLDNTHACLMCLSLDHTTQNCEHVRELVPGNFNQERSGRDIYATEYHSDSEDMTHMVKDNDPKASELHLNCLAASAPANAGLGKEDCVDPTLVHKDADAVFEPSTQYRQEPGLAKRGRGRPRKEYTAKGDANATTTCYAKQGRGRPREQNNTAKGDANPTTTCYPKRGRGRPREQNNTVKGDADATTTSYAKRGRGRPHKENNTAKGNADATTTCYAKRGRGRPRKQNNILKGDTDVTTSHYAHDAAVDTQETGDGQRNAFQCTIRGRGRPRKKPRTAI
ncbi:hypothetical protein POM88_028478 [Heracleum sosnowskyi]|uniref:DUF4283 domain-containing protein n=1 Tax=Heracleum sosnowskyi TaxID=360622 RepID=A0AAD8ME39_9APIA|nr:hypothetical protein POM88_028478 [Heracleum sosnowskyi]